LEQLRILAASIFVIAAAIFIATGLDLGGRPLLGLVIGLGMLVNLFFAGLSDAVIPLIMKRIGLDLAQSVKIILTTITDVIGFFLPFSALQQCFRAILYSMCQGRKKQTDRNIAIVHP